MAVKVPEIEVDGVICEVYDNDAIHTNELADVLSQPAIRQVIGNLFFPIGSYYITESDTNPATLFGGTWTAVTGRVIMGADGMHPVGSVGGSEDLVVPNHRHYIDIDTMDGGSHTHTVGATAAAAGSHQHTIGDRWSSGSGKETAYKRSNDRTRTHIATDAAGSHSHSVSGTAYSAGLHSHHMKAYSNYSGEDGTGKNNMPYRAAYIWRRTA